MNKSKQKGTSFESAVVEYLRSALCDSAIERRTLGGTKDRGDIAGVYIGSERCVIECKACSTYKVSEWLKEAERERKNDAAAAGVVCAKRKGVGAANMGDQLVMMTLQQFAEIVKRSDNERYNSEERNNS